MNKVLFPTILVLTILPVPASYAGGAAALRRNAEQQRQIQQQIIRQNQQEIQHRVAEQQQRQLQAELMQRRQQIQEQIRLQREQQVQAQLRQQQAQIQRNIRVHVQNQQFPDEIRVSGPSIPPEVARQLAPPPDEVKDVVTLDDVVSSLEVSSQDWTLMIDRQAKEMVVSQFIERAREQGAAIRKSPAHYVSLIDSMSQESPGMLAQPFDQVLRVVAIIEYDYDNGQSPDAMALKVLGSQEAVETNRQRLWNAPNY